MSLEGKEKKGKLKKVSKEKITAVSDAMIMAIRVCESVSAIFKYDDIKEMLKCIIKKTDVDIHSCTLAPPDWDMYGDDYYIVINKDGIYVEKAKADNGEYLYSEDDVMIVGEECEILESNKFSECNNFIIVNECGVRIPSDRSRNVIMLASFYDMLNGIKNS